MSALPWEQLCAELSALGWDFKKSLELDQLFIWFYLIFMSPIFREEQGTAKPCVTILHPFLLLTGGKKSANCSVVYSSFLDFIFLSWSPPWMGKGSACHLSDVGIPKPPGEVELS